MLRRRVHDASQQLGEVGLERYGDLKHGTELGRLHRRLQPAHHRDHHLPLHAQQQHAAAEGAHALRPQALLVGLGDSLHSSVRICQNSSMYAIDEYYDELEDSATLTAENVEEGRNCHSQTFCWVDLTHKKFEKIHAKPKGLASRLKQLVKPAKAEVTSIYSPFGFLSTQGGIVTVVGKNGSFAFPASLPGSQFLQSLYGYTDRGDDEISGKLFYNGSPLSPSELLMLASYVDNRGWLCGSLTVEEYVQQTIELNSPLWM